MKDKNIARLGQEKMFRKKGFTLLELIIVIVVIGILASIALPRYTKVAERARMAEGKHILGEIRSAQMRYLLSHSVFTNDSDDLDIEIASAKYFLPVNLSGVQQPHQAENPLLGRIQRTSIDAGEFAYWITIYEDGTFNCTPIDSGECPE